MNSLDFYKDKKILITGNTGFKGTWLSKVLLQAGAQVLGYSLDAPTEPGLYHILRMENQMRTVRGDICDFEKLSAAFKRFQPEIVFHLAAQPLVQESYRSPRETYAVNVMGTVNVLECVRLNTCVKSFLNITTDKVYKNNEWFWGYREEDVLNGYDPYSNSKSCSELITETYKRSFLGQKEVAVSTARAGNVIGGGDFAKGRILPDCVRAALQKSDIVLRNPYSVRPYQHVLEALHGYLLIAEKQYKDINLQGAYNIGPQESSCITTLELTKIFCQNWGMHLKWEISSGQKDMLHEAHYLKLDCSKIKGLMKWNTVWDIETAVKKVVDWTRAWSSGEKQAEIELERQIMDFWRQIDG